MPFLSSNKDSCRTHQGSQRLHQICAVSSSSDSGRFLTLRNISLAQVPGQRNPPSDLSRSFDEKCDDAFPSPMLQEDAIYGSGDFRDALAVAPIEILPLTNVENVTPVKYQSLDLSDLSFSSLNESLEGSENFPGALKLETPNIRRVSFPNRRREYVLSMRPLGALGAGVITTSSTRGRQSNSRSSVFGEGRSSLDARNTSLQLKKALENQSDRRKTIHSWQVMSPPKKVQRSESTPDSYTTREPWKTPSIKSTLPTSLLGHGRREIRPQSLDLQACSKSGNLFANTRTSDRQTSLQEFKVESTKGTNCHPAFGCEETLEKPTGLRTKLIFSPSKNGLPLVRVKRSAPIILSRKGKTKNPLSTFSQNSTHFTPSKFLNNPQSSTPVSKRLRDRRNSLLDDVHDVNFLSPLKFNPSCKKQIFPDLDDPVPSAVSAAPILHPVLSFESAVDEFQVDFGHGALPLVSEGHKDPLVTPSKELTGSYQDDQMFSPMMRLFVDSPVGSDHQDVRRIVDNSTATLENAIDFQLASSVVSFDALFDMAGDCFDFEDDAKVVAPKVIQPQPIGESYSAVRDPVGEETSPSGPGSVQISVVDKSGDYFVCNDEQVETYIFCDKDGSIFNVVGNAVVGGLRNLQQQQRCDDGSDVSAMNVTDIMENDLPDTFMKVVCCETTHRKSLVQQAREVLGVSEPPQELKG